MALPLLSLPVGDAYDNDDYQMRQLQSGLRRVERNQELLLAKQDFPSGPPSANGAPGTWEFRHVKTWNIFCCNMSGSSYQLVYSVGDDVGYKRNGQRRELWPVGEREFQTFSALCIVWIVIFVALGIGLVIGFATGVL